MSKAGAALYSHQTGEKCSLACPLMLANLLLITIFGPIVVVNCTLYFLPNSFLVLEQEWQSVMSMHELVSILAFVVCDILLALALLAIRDFTSIYNGCSSTLTPLKVNCGSGYIPICLCFKWLLRGGKLFLNRNGLGSVYYCVLLLALLFVLATFQLASLLRSEYHFVLTIFRFSNSKQRRSPEDGIARHLRSRLSPTALLFIALRSCLVLCMLIDLFVVQPKAVPLFSEWKLSSPMALDYPLLLSVLNLAFIFFAHQSIEVAYHVAETKCTALTQEYVCCEGSLCSSAFHHRKLLAYTSIDQLLHPSAIQIADVEREIRSEYDLPEWLRLQIFEVIYTNTF